MSWEKKKVLVTVKAYPEKSKTHGHVVCTAGITEEGDFIRLYPVNDRIYFGKEKVKKFDWIEVFCKKANDEKLKRKESYKVRDNTIKIIDSTLSSGSPVKWSERNDLVYPLISSSIKELQEAFIEDKTSLGLIKPKELINFYANSNFEKAPEIHSFQKNLFTEEKIPIVDDIQKIFSYKFKCENCYSENPCNKKNSSHDMVCVDWELYEAYRKWSRQYSSKEELWNKLQNKFFTNMNERNIHFFMGTHSQYPTWMIIGLYYPPIPEKDPSIRTLADFF